MLAYKGLNGSETKVGGGMQTATSAVSLAPVIRSFDEPRHLRFLLSTI